MNLPRLSVRRPVFTAMVTLIVVVLGGVSLIRLQIDMLPEIERPTLTIDTEWAGASPEVMEQRVTRIIEEIVATVPGVEELSSRSTEGESEVRVSFAWGTDIDTAALDVQSKIEDEISELPEDIIRPQIRKFDISSFPIVLMGVQSALDPVELTTLVEEQLRHRFAQIPGVAQVDPWGSYKREVRVELHPGRVRALGLPLDRVLEALRDANLDLPAGQIDQGQQSVTLRAPAEFTSVDQIRDTIVVVRDGAPVRLRQIAEVHDTHRKLQDIARINGELGLRLAIRKQSDANTVEVSQRILAEVDEVNHEFPQIHITPVINQGNFIERSISNVARSLLYGGGLAVVVLLFFLRNVRSTVVISLAIPISLMATFALAYFSGLTLNLMTLGGLALGVGMMVDNSIVALENIYRRRDELGEATADAAVHGASEVGPPILASTITTLVIFLPLVFIEGIAAVLFRDLAYVVAFSLACSLLVSLTIVPMLSSRLLDRRHPERRLPGLATRLAGIAEGGFRRVEGGYRRLLGSALKRRGLTVMTTLLGLGLSLLLVPFIGTELLPPSDEGEVTVVGEMSVGTKLELVDRQTRLLESLVYPKVPETRSSLVSVEAGGEDGAQGDIRLSLVPASERERSNTEIAASLRRQLEGQVPGMKIRTRAPQGQFVLNRLMRGDEGLTVEVHGYELDVLKRLARRAAEVTRGVAGVTDVEISRKAGTPQQEFQVDRDKAADLGLSPRDVARTLEIGVAGADAGEYRVRGNSYRILVQLEDAENLPLSEILDMTVSNPSGEDIPLRNVVETKASRGPTVIERRDQQRVVTVSANVAGRDMGSVAEDIDRQLDGIARPVGYQLGIAGSFEEQQRAFEQLIISLVLALALVYMVLAAQYESLRDPLVVMASVPMAAIGVLVVLALTGTTLNVQSYIGCIMLAGIVVNNAILLVDQARRLTLDGQPPRDAVAEAGRRRFRPILMTTMTTILALLPLALGIGEGADAQAPMARAVLGGLAGSSLITLVLVPAVYSLVHRGGRNDVASASREERGSPEATPAIGGGA